MAADLAARAQAVTDEVYCLMQYYSNFPTYNQPLREGLALVQQLLSTCEASLALSVFDIE